jgi:cytoplasmic iron level regulating protein YaaA (DUF328/UPF0246 family)
MKIILSPSKLQTPRSLKGVEGVCHPYFESSQVIDKILRTMNYEDLGKCLRINKALLDHAYHLWNGDTYTSGHAICTYTGIVFKEIACDAYDSVQLDYLERHLRILSAYYGVLTPLTQIKPYRLDMTHRPSGLDLYKHWQEVINQAFSHEDLVVNLASKEFSAMLNRKVFKGNVLDIEFKEEHSDGVLKVVTVRAKQARGLMTHYMVENTIESTEHLKGFSEAGYEFHEALSRPDYYLFIKPYDV